MIMHLLHIWGHDKYNFSEWWALGRGVPKYTAHKICINLYIFCSGGYFQKVVVAAAGELCEIQATRYKACCFTLVKCVHVFVHIVYEW